MKTITLNAPAKVNLALRILGKMPNGYHRIESFMQSVSLCDEVTVSCKTEDAGGLTVTLDPGRSDLPAGEENLAYRAAVLMHEEFRAGISEKIDIKIIKNIPVAAGLAGGSADGAAVIASLALLWGLAEKTEGQNAPECSGPVLEKLCSIAARLGSDVPFCLMNHFGVSAAVATGTGTEIKKAEGIKCTLAMITPAINVSTKAVYKELTPSDYMKDSPISSEKLCTPGSLAEKTAFMGNDLKAPALRLFPQIQETLGALAALEPKPLYVQLSGSGPSCFAIYESGKGPENSSLARAASLSDGFFTVCETRC